MKDWQDVWQRLRSGQHVVLRGAERIPEPDPRQLAMATVDCVAFPEPRGTLDEARRQIHAFLGTSSIVDAAARRLRAGLRRHLLGEDSERIDASSYEDVFSRGVAASPRPLALCLRGVERADAQSLEMLIHLFAGPHKPQWPLLISFDQPHPSGAARLLLEQLERVLPVEAFWHGAGVVPDAGATSIAEALSRVSPSTLRVLRAAAAIGDRFEVEVVGHLLALDELAVLDAVQEALDVGLTLEDRGRGVIRLEPRLAAALREQTLPALARAWHERLGELFGGAPAPSDIVQAQASVAPLGDVAPLPDASLIRQEARDCFEASAGVAALPADPRNDAWWQRLNDAAMSVGAGRDGTVTAPSAEASAADLPSLVAGDAARPGPDAADGPRATDPEENPSDKELAAAERFASLGQHEDALASSARALAWADQVGDPERRRVLRARALLVIG